MRQACWLGRWPPGARRARAGEHLTRTRQAAKAAGTSPLGRGMIVTRFAPAALLAATLTLTACGAQGLATSTSPAGTDTPNSVSQTTAPPGSTGLPCNPASRTCGVPDVKDVLMSYAPAHHYTDARALAAAAHCQVLHPGQANVVAPTTQRAICTLNGATEGDALTEVQVFRSWPAEANQAQTMVTQAYNNDAYDYAVVGPGWIFGPVTASVDDSAAVAIQQSTGGEVVCLPGYDTNGGGC